MTTTIDFRIGGFSTKFTLVSFDKALKQADVHECSIEDAMSRVRAGQGPCAFYNPEEALDMVAIEGAISVYGSTGSISNRDIANRAS